MVDETNPPEKKLVIDEDWKSQVEREREEAAHPAETPPPEQAAAAAADDDIPLPPADFLFLLGTLYLQGAIALGMMPNPITQKIERKPVQAKHTIDLLSMLQQKTAGNRTPEESADLENMLHQLRMAFVAVSAPQKP